MTTLEALDAWIEQQRMATEKTERNARTLCIYLDLIAPGLPAYVTNEWTVGVKVLTVTATPAGYRCSDGSLFDLAQNAAMWLVDWSVINGWYSKREQEPKE